MREQAQHVLMGYFQGGTACTAGIAEQQEFVRSFSGPTV